MDEDLPTPRPDDPKLWTIRDVNTGWFDVMYRERTGDRLGSWLVVAKVYSLGRAEIVQNALIAAYGGKVYERPRRSVGALPREEFDVFYGA